MKSMHHTDKPTKKQIIFPIVVLIVTLVIGVGLFLGAKFVSNKSGKTYFLAPGSEVFQIEEPGSYTVDLTTKVISDKMSYRLPENFSELHIEVTFNGEEIPWTKVEESSIYGEENHQSRSYLSFEVDEPGAYQITSSIEDSTIAQLELSIGKTQKNLELALILVTCSGMLILMGVCQFIAYMILNLGRWLYVYYKTK